MCKKTCKHIHKLKPTGVWPCPDVDIRLNSWYRNICKTAPEKDSAEISETNRSTSVSMQRILTRIRLPKSPGYNSEQLNLNNANFNYWQVRIKHLKVCARAFIFKNKQRTRIKFAVWSKLTRVAAWCKVRPTNWRWVNSFKGLGTTNGPVNAAFNVYIHDIFKVYAASYSRSTWCRLPIPNLTNLDPSNRIFSKLWHGLSTRGKWGQIRKTLVWNRCAMHTVQLGLFILEPQTMNIHIVNSIKR